APWPERIFNGKYPRRSADAKTVPAEYATELQVVFNALNDMKQERVDWDCGTTGIGVLVSDSLMFERGEPQASEGNMAHFYGLALPFVKRGIPITPVQLENVTVADYLKPFRILLLSYHGQKPLTSDVHTALAKWVRDGGALIVVDDDSDPYNKVREWWNSGGMNFATPREHLFQAVGESNITWIKDHPGSMAYSTEKEAALVATVKARAKNWKETNYLLLRRGPYVIASGLDESVEGPAKTIEGRFVNLFDSELQVHRRVTVGPASRIFLRDLDDAATRSERVIAAGCKVIATKENTFVVEGIANTEAVVLMRAKKKPARVTLGGNEISAVEFSDSDKLLWMKFTNEATPRVLTVEE
ncbi:MAG TPA: hypothetical protein VI282_17275, partial [Verrucomicrobiae bacterium]